MELVQLTRKRNLIAEAALDLAISVEKETTAAAVSGRFQRFIEDDGFTSVVCLVVDKTRPLAASDILMSTRPKDWLASYLAEGHMAFDPVLAAAHRTKNAFAWSDVVDYRRLEPAARKVMGHAAQHGMRDGFVIPIRGPRRAIGLVSLAGPRRRLSEANRAVLALVGTYVHQRLVALSHQRIDASVNLTKREVEIARWIAAGKSDWQIGQILAISAKTVNYHVENIKRKFGVASRVQAVLAASSQGGFSH